MKIYSENKKGYFDYNILEKFEAGIVLFGQEVKSIKTGHINLSGSYVTLKAPSSAKASAGKVEPYLTGVRVPPYQPNNAGADYNESRERKLLLNKKEIDYLVGKSAQKGFSLIPLKIYDKHGRIKLEFGLAKGKKKYDKKEKIKKRDAEREVNRELSE
ncbi:MAG: SsrA-binding protein SmpB [bacterium]